MVEGNGAVPVAGQSVRVHYHGTFTHGGVFDSSVARGQPAEFPVTGVIAGWVETLPDDAGWLQVEALHSAGSGLRCPWCRLHPINAPLWYSKWSCWTSCDRLAWCKTATLGSPFVFEPPKRAMCLRRVFGYSQASSISGHVRGDAMAAIIEVVDLVKHFPASRRWTGSALPFPPAAVSACSARTGRARPDHRAAGGILPGQRPDPVSRRPRGPDYRSPHRHPVPAHGAAGFPDGARYPASVRQPLPQSPLPRELLIDLCALGEFIDRDSRKLSGPASAPAAGPGPARGSPNCCFWMSPPQDWIPGAPPLLAANRGDQGQGKTVVLTTHYMDKPQQLCDRLPSSITATCSVWIRRLPCWRTHSTACWIASWGSPGPGWTRLSPASGRRSGGALLPDVATCCQPCWILVCRSPACRCAPQSGRSLPEPDRPQPGAAHERDDRVLSDRGLRAAVRLADMQSRGGR